MSVALVEHTGPWTADDVEALPDAGDHARFEVYEGGVLVVTPTSWSWRPRQSVRRSPGFPGRITRPFAVELDPADLTRCTA
jgi:hypothetical protein